VPAGLPHRPSSTVGQVPAHETHPGDPQLQLWRQSRRPPPSDGAAGWMDRTVWRSTPRRPEFTPTTASLSSLPAAIGCRWQTQLDVSASTARTLVEVRSRTSRRSQGRAGLLTLKDRAFGQQLGAPARINSSKEPLPAEISPACRPVQRRWGSANHPRAAERPAAGRESSCTSPW